MYKLLGRKYTVDMNGDMVPVSKSLSAQKINQLKDSNVNLSKLPETNV